MKGKIHKTDEKWMISRCVGDGVAEVWEEQIPLHPDDIKQINADAQVFDNIEARIAAYPDVEFEIVEEWKGISLGTKALSHYKVSYAKLKQNNA